MSGISAVYGAPDEDAVGNILARLKHRGTRETGTLVCGRAVLGYTADCDGAAFAGDGTAIILDGDAVTRRSTAASILQMIVERGPEALSELDGAFALAAQTPNGLVVARDRFGLKPLYYGRVSGKVFFASELKALADICDEISLVSPGHYVSPGGSADYRPERERGTDGTTVPPSPEAAEAQLRELLTRAVTRRLPDRGSLGVFLSGGLDSSIITAIAARVQGPVKTFAAGYEGSPDLHYARVVADYLGTDHAEYRYSRAEMLGILPEVIYHLESYDWSLVRSAVANYFVARLAREHGTDCVLVGEGADELFGGYHYLKDKEPKAQVRELKKLLGAGHNIGFQRVDRMTAAHSLDFAAPFMDCQVIRAAVGLPMEWKIHAPDSVEKWILRRAFNDYLPQEIVWRRKDEFSQGAGSAGVIETVAEQEVSDADFEREREPFPGCRLVSKEELYYYRIFREFFPQRAAMETVGHWRPW